MRHDADWADLRRAYRHGVFRVLDNIRAGSVTDEDLGKLNNFCAVSLMLMSKVQAGAWRAAEKEAHIASLLFETTQDCSE